MRLFLFYKWDRCQLDANHSNNAKKCEWQTSHYPCNVVDKKWYDHTNEANSKTHYR